MSSIDREPKKSLYFDVNHMKPKHWNVLTSAENFIVQRQIRQPKSYNASTVF